MSATERYLAWDAATLDRAAEHGCLDENVETGDPVVCGLCVQDGGVGRQAIPNTPTSDAGLPRDIPPATDHGDAPRMATVRFRSPGGRWLTVTGEVVEPACICDQITSRLFSCPVHPAGMA